MKMNCYKIPVIILGGDITALAVSRNLGINRVKVLHVSKEKNEVAYSRYCKKSFIIPDIEKRKESLKKFLLNKNLIKDQAVLFPCSDLLCINLSQIQNDLGEKYIYFTDRRVTPILVNKRNFYWSLYKNKVPHPKTYFPENYKDLKEIGKSVIYPVLIKPAITQLFGETFGSKSFIARSKRDLEKYYKLVLKYNIEFVIQEIIPGPPTNLYGLVGYFDKNHNPKGLFAYRRIREWPPGFGNNSLIESCPVQEVSSIKNITINYLRNLQYCGLFEAEFKKDPHSGSFNLLEINARSWWQNHFPTICGINLVMMAYMDAIGEKIEYKETYETGVKWIHFINDVFSLFGMLKKGDLRFYEWVQSYKNIKDHAYFNANDLLPWFIHPLIIGPVYFRSLVKKFLG